MSKKLKVGFHPYTFVRTNVMRSLLLKKEDYQKLLKMKLSEITKYLQEMHYAKEINELGATMKSSELLEVALHRNQDRSLNKLKEISKGNLKVLVETYLERYDVQNVKTVLRSLGTQQDKSEVETLLSEAGRRSKKFYQDLLDMSYDDALEKLKQEEIIDFETEDKSQMEVETELEKNYFKRLLELADNLKNKDIYFEELINKEIATKNIMTLLRMKRGDIPEKKIRELMILLNKNQLIEDLLEAESVEDALEILEDSSFSDALEQGIKDYKENGSLIEIERELKRHLLKRAVLLAHKDFLSINSILGYMFAKEIEVRNLSVLIKGKKLDMDDEYLQKEMIT